MKKYRIVSINNDYEFGSDLTYMYGGYNRPEKLRRKMPSFKK
jgi:hypothetical protein